MSQKLPRKSYLLHPSSQLKYVEMTVVPALLMCVLCTSFLIRSGEVFLTKEKTQLAVEVAYLSDTTNSLEHQQYPADTLQKIEVLKKRLSIMRNNLEIQYLETVKQWNNTKVVLFLFAAIVILTAGCIALVFSHRIAGPLVRLRRVVEGLAEGKDAGMVKFRTYDEFKELAAAVEKLRKVLKEKGMVA